MLLRVCRAAQLARRNTTPYPPIRRRTLNVIRWVANTLLHAVNHWCVVVIDVALLAEICDASLVG